jgi:p21-activated kinase 1
VTLPTIVLQPDVREEDEDGDGDGDGEEVVEHDYSQSASPLYHELMGMMQGRAASANGVGSPGPGSPASAMSFQLDTASTSSYGAASRDSQLTIRFNPRDSSRDSSASTSTLTHATIVRGASVVRRVRADVVTTPPVYSTMKGKERNRGPPPVEIVQVAREDDEDDDDEGEGDSSSGYADSDEDGSPGSPAGTLAFTSAPNSQEDAGGGCRKSVRQVFGHGSPLPSPSPSPLRASFPETISEEHAAHAQAQSESESEEVPIAVPPSSKEGQEQQVENNDGIVRPRFTFTGAATPRYPAWLAAVVLPLAEFIDDSADPRALFSDLQEIAQGESGSVYSARAVPAVAPQFRPPPPRSPTPGAGGISSSRSSTPEKVKENDEYEDEDEQSEQKQQQHQLVAIKRVPLLRGGTEKLMDLRRELELARAVRHANVLRMERLYVDVAEECLWIGMELMDRSLADVLAVVGEDAGSGSDLAAEEGSGLVEIPEKMVARFVWDVSNNTVHSFFFSLWTDWGMVCRFFWRCRSSTNTILRIGIYGRIICS